MPRSEAKTVAAYLKELPAERRAVIAKVRDVVLRHLPKGYVEAMNWGMICYEVPLERFPDTYNKQPAMFAALAAQKNYYTLHLMAACDPRHLKELGDAFRKIGKKMDIGRACLRFKSVDDLPLDAIGKLIAAMPPEKMMEMMKASRKR
jgi:hypothetical protein